jgi:hypothetical protein
MKPLAAMLLVAVVLSAQDKPVAAPPKKLDEWPALKDTDRDRVLAMAAQFKKDSKLHEAARNGLVGVGEAAMPLLFQQVSDRQEASNEQLFLVFDKVIGPQHAAIRRWPRCWSPRAATRTPRSRSPARSARWR